MCVVYIEKCGATLLVGAWQREKQQNKLVERKPFVDTMRNKSADLKNFCSRVLRLSENASKPVARHLNLPNHSMQHIAVCGLSLHQGSTESRKTLEQKFILFIYLFILIIL